MSKRAAKSLENNAMPALEMRGAIVPDSVNEAEKTLRVQYTTGARVFRPQYFDEDYYEELDTSPGAVRLGRMKSGAAPVLNSHRPYDLDDVLGVVVDADETHATVRFSEREELQGIWRDILRGVIRNISVGYLVHKYQDVTPSDDKIRVLRAIDWEPLEISFVAIGADGGAGVRSATKETSRCVVIGGRENLNQDEESMSKKTQKGARAVDPVTKVRAEEDDKTVDNGGEETEADGEGDEGDQTDETGSDTPAADDAPTESERAIMAERTRASEIRKMVRGLDLPERLADEMINKGVTVDKARATVIERMAKKDEETPTRSRVTAGGQDEIVTKRQAAENYLLHRHNPVKNPLTDPAREMFRGLSLLEMARKFIPEKELRGMSKMEVAARAFHSTSDFPNILAAVTGKSLRQAYADTRRTFLPFTRRVDLPDFKAVNRAGMSNFSNLEPVLEGGEYKRGTFSENGATIQLMTYGKIFGITRQAIINDDLDAMTRVPAKMAAAAARLERNEVYDILTSNPTMEDGVTLFHADHANLYNVDVDVAGIGAIRAGMAKQTDPSGGDLVGAEPKYLIVPVALETAALQLKTGISPVTAATVNPYSNSFEVIAEAYLDLTSATNFFMAADPSTGVDTIEWGYLEGEDGPTLETKEGWDRDGMEFKVRHDFFAKAVDHIGLAKST